MTTTRTRTARATRTTPAKALFFFELSDGENITVDGTVRAATRPDAESAVLQHLRDDLDLEETCATEDGITLGWKLVEVDENPAVAVNGWRHTIAADRGVWTFDASGRVTDNNMSPEAVRKFFK